ncbi:hypothetical protein Y1Q_0006792 [Alligator mississippiensis]|uniref:Uncharacterized protein n=1 Tax=Alligator mississippiensis TaxID=8496 RepID=A0A151M5Q9_ALLMI|nr:hypothetical protein Y1Q_0006792 [Alligator mississippiensis]
MLRREELPPLRLRSSTPDEDQEQCRGEVEGWGTPSQLCWAALPGARCGRTLPLHGRNTMAGSVVSR